MNRILHHCITRIALCSSICFWMLSCSSSTESPVVQCAAEFGVPWLENYELEIFLSQAGGWSTMPKYHFVVREDDYDEIVGLLEKSGYSNWRRGELTVGKASFGSKESDLEFAYQNRSGLEFYAAVSREFQYLIFMRFP